MKIRRYLAGSRLPVIHKLLPVLLQYLGTVSHWLQQPVVVSAGTLLNAR